MILSLVDGKNMINLNSMHPSNYKNITHISISGYSIKPIMNYNHLKNFFIGLFSYPEKWYCDHNQENIENKKDILGKIPGGPEKKLMPYTKNTIVHKGNFGNIIFEPYIIENENKFSTHAFIIFENGYLTLNAIEYEKYVPIFINIFTTINDIDVDLLIDHFRAPAIEADGLGLFNYEIAINKKPIFFDNYYILQTIDREFANKLHYGYGINGDEYIKLKSVRQNDLDNKIYCIHCDKEATYWDIVSDKSMPVCKEHNLKMNFPYRTINFHGADDILES